MTGGFGLPKAARLLSPADFRRAMSTRRTAASEHFVVFAAPLDGDRSRLGITVSRRAGGAVRRNQLKRWIRESVRHALPRFEFPVDLVVLARKKASFEQLHHAAADAQLEHLYRRLGLLR